jgi:hypothetical protein
MDLAKVLAQLHAELDNVNAAIESLERIKEGGRRRGRPPVWLNKQRGEDPRGGPAATQQAPKRARRRPS